MYTIATFSRHFCLEIPYTNIDRLGWIPPASDIVIRQLELPPTLTGLKINSTEYNRYRYSVVAIVVDFQVRINGCDLCCIAG